MPDSSAIFQRMKKGLCTNAYFSLTRQPPALRGRPEFQRKYLKCADPCGQHVEIGIFDSVISTFFIVRILRNV